jgi:hypothetical protein
VFIGDNLKDCYETSRADTLRLLMPVLILFSASFVGSYLPSFKHEPAAVYFLYQNIQTLLILKLMLANMTKVTYILK